MWALGLLPFLHFAATCRFVTGKVPSLSLRDVIITSALFTSAWVVAGTELLSLLRLLSFWPLLAWWAAPCVFLMWLCRGAPIGFKLNPPGDRVLTGIIAACAATLLATFVVAAITPPTNWDALSYHLPRQVYWMQQKHAGVFATNDVRMLSMPPFAEYVGANLMILSGGDRWANLIQWFAFGLASIAASCIARELQASARMQAVSALLVLSIPAAALESMNPKNDVVAAFFLCAMAWKALDIFRAKSPAWLHCVLFALASGLLALTKSTGVFFAAPIGIWAAVTIFHRHPFPRAFRYASAIAALAIAVNLGHWTRMYQEFHSPFGPPVSQWGRSLVNSIHTPKAVVSNLLRNFSMHLGTPSESLNTCVFGTVKEFHDLIRFDLNDRRTTFVASAPFGISGDFADEDRAKAPFHVLLGTAALFLIFDRLVRKKDWAINVFMLIPYFAFLLFCYVLTWQEWHARLHIPILCLLAPTTVYALSGRPKFLFAIVTAAFLLSACSVMCNEAKPVIGARSILAHSRSQMGRIPIEAREGFRLVRAACRERQPKLIGIYAAGEREYGLLKVLLRSEGRPGFFKMNASLGGKFRPRVIAADIVIGWYGVPAEANRGFYTNFSAVYENGPVHIFARTPSPDEPRTIRTQLRVPDN